MGEIFFSSPHANSNNSFIVSCSLTVDVYCMSMYFWAFLGRTLLNIPLAYRWSKGGRFYTLSCDKEVGQSQKGCRT